MIWKVVPKALRRSAGRFRHMQVSERLSVEKCNKPVMHFLETTDIGKFQHKQLLSELAGNEQRSTSWQAMGRGVTVSGLSLIASQFPFYVIDRFEMHAFLYQIRMTCSMSATPAASWPIWRSRRLRGCYTPRGLNTVELNEINNSWNKEWLYGAHRPESGTSTSTGFSGSVAG